MRQCEHFGRRSGVSRRCVLPEGHGVPIHSYQQPRRESAGRAVEERAYSKLRRGFLEAHPACQSPLGCGQPATQVHHKAGRVGVLLTDVSRWVAICAGCHQHFTEHPTEAYDCGISERRVGAA